jgi:hypothetical protein
VSGQYYCNSEKAFLFTYVVPLTQRTLQKSDNPSGKPNVWQGRRRASPPVDDRIVVAPQYLRLVAEQLKLISFGIDGDQRTPRFEPVSNPPTTRLARCRPTTRLV